ncbi:MAG: hypothetical protein ABIQ81_09545 [Novosphingobium sp.]
MTARFLIALAAGTLLGANPGHAAEPAAKPTAASPAAVAIPPRQLLTLDEAKRQPNGPLSQKVLAFLTVMDRVVNKPKQPAITAADWEPLGDLVDRQKFRRVGNFGVRNDWPSYAGLLTQWANYSWWKGRIWRLREVPAADGKSGLVYLESEERSNQKHPVADDGDYSTLASIAVYEIDRDGKITALWVYDQRPL